MLPLVAVGLLAAVAASLATWAAMSRPETPAAAPVTRLAITLPAAQPLALSFNAPDIALSPDGTHLAFTVGLQSQLIVRALDQLDAAPIEGITGARAPFFSPDGRWVGFFDQGGELRKVSIDGGRPIAICKVDGTSRGASWGTDDVIVFATSTSGGLLSVPAAGGEATMLAAVAAGERGFWFPSVLPDGQGIVYTVAATDGGGQLRVSHLDRNGERTPLVEDAAQGVYVEGGYLTYAASGSLWATRFSPATRQVSGARVRILDDVVVVFGDTGANVALSRRGTVAYARASGDPARTLAWISRDGRETSVPAPARAYQIPRLSDDDRRLVVFANELERNGDLWTWDLSRSEADQTLRRFTFEGGSYPLWSPDGHIVFNSLREGVQNIYRRASDSNGGEHRLTRGPNNQRPLAVSADGRHLIFEEGTTDAAWNLMRLTLDGASSPEVLLKTPFDERNGDLSPDGRWMAYDSNETGETEVYVRPFPDVNREVFQVSSNGGRTPGWSPSGGELFFAKGTTLYSVAVRLAPTFRHGPPIALFDRPSVTFDARQFTNGNAARQFDVAKDGQRFLAMKVADADDPATTRHSIVVLHNWFENAAIP